MCCAPSRVEHSGHPAPQHAPLRPRNRRACTFLTHVSCHTYVRCRSAHARTTEVAHAGVQELVVMFMVSRPSIAKFRVKIIFHASNKRTRILLSSLSLDYMPNPTCSGFPRCTNGTMIDFFRASCSQSEHAGGKEKKKQRTQISWRKITSVQEEAAGLTLEYSPRRQRS